MRVTSIGHAGLFFETRFGTILADPWFTPAYFGSWFPFPANDGLDAGRLGAADYLYVSHLHRDHFDPVWLAAHMRKDTTVLLPESPVPQLRRALEDVGFTRFVSAPSGEPFEIDGLRLMIVALTAPNDGPIGDSCLAVDDGTARVLNQNDGRPPDIEVLSRFGEYDAHFLQYSGAIWYPVVYDLPDRTKAALGRQKRLGGIERARKYTEAVGARHVFPNSGPPAFLDDDLFFVNDLGTADSAADDTNPFPDQQAFLAYLAASGVHNAHLVLTGSVVELDNGQCTVRHEGATPEEVFGDKRAYLTAYAQRMKPVLDAERASWHTGDTPLLPALRTLLEPLMAQAALLSRRLGDRVLLDLGANGPDGFAADERIVLDFPNATVTALGDDEDPLSIRYAYRVDRRLVRTLLDEHSDDWVNSLFLSCRFSASRRGPYNEHIYTFFKSLSAEKIAYVEAWLAEDRPITARWRFGDHLVQRFCPHLGADLARFGHSEGGILTCDLHGWTFDLTTGKCLTSDDVHLDTREVAPAADPAL